MVTCNATASEPCYPSPGNLTNPVELFQQANNVTGGHAVDMMVVVLWVAVFASMYYYERSQNPGKAALATSIIIFFFAVVLNIVGLVSGWMLGLLAFSLLAFGLFEHTEDK